MPGMMEKGPELLGKNRSANGGAKSPAGGGGGGSSANGGLHFSEPESGCSSDDEHGDVGMRVGAEYQARIPEFDPAPTRPGGARPQDSGRGCQGDIFSGAARFQRPPPAQLAGSLSTFLQTGSPAVTGCEAARGLGESSAYGGALAGASGPGVLGCSNPARLAAPPALPRLDRPLTFPAVSFCPESILAALRESAV